MSFLLVTSSHVSRSSRSGWPRERGRRYLLQVSTAAAEPIPATEHMSTAEPNTPSESIDDPRRKSALFIVFLVVFIDLLGFGIVLPLLPRIADDYLAGYGATAKGAIIGMLYSSFSIMQFVFSPMWGRVSDRIGRRPILMLGLAGSVVFYALFGYASSLPSTMATTALVLLLLSRVGAGIAGASVGTAAAVIADCTPPERRAKGMALIGAAFGIGFTFGPLIAYAGLKFFENAPWAPGIMASALSFGALLTAIVLLPETLRPGPRTHREFFSLSRTAEVLRMPTVGVLVLIYFLVIFAFANFEGTLSLFTESAFRLDNNDNFLVFAYIGFVLMVAQGGIYRPLSTRRSEQHLMQIGIGLMLVGLGGLAGVAYGTHLLRLSPDAPTGLKPLFYLSVTVAVFGFAFLNPSVAALVSKRSDPTRQGEVLGVNQSFSALGRIFGPLVGSTVFYLHDSRILPYLVGAGVMVGVLALVPAVRGTEERSHRGTEDTESEHTEIRT